ncbi:MAG: hypothetical protein WC455_24320 [Dehalococcoidia bacterium]|jgi:hypothetical protein
MAYVELTPLQKNSLPAKTTSLLAAGGSSVDVDDQSVFYRDSVLLTKGWVLGPDNSTESYTEEVTISATDAATGAGTVTISARAIKADGTNGAAREWPIGTVIKNTYTTSIHDQIKDNFAALPQSRNLIINGDCRVNQRVTAYTLVKDAYTWDSDDLTGPDRHEGMATGTAVSAGTWEQTLTATAGSSGYAFKFAGVTLTGTGILYHRYRMEAKDAVRFKNQTASFSASVHQDTGSAINYTVYIRKADASNNFSAVTAISDSGAISVPSATKTALKYENISMGDCSNGIEIEIKIECGAVTTKNFEQTELQFEHGSVATAFEIRSYPLEQYYCNRFCEDSYQDIAPGSATGVDCITLMAVSTNYLLGWPFKTAKLAAPTVYIWSNDGTPGKVNHFGHLGDIGTTLTPGGIGKFCVTYIADSGSGFVKGDGYSLHFLAVCEL